MCVHHPRLRSPSGVRGGGLDDPLPELRRVTMLRSSSPQRGPKLNITAIIVFDRKKGRIHGTYLHGSIEEADEVGVKRSRHRLLAEIVERLGCKATALDAIEVPHEDLPSASLDRVDPKKRRLVPTTS